MILAVVLIYLILLLWALAKAPDWATGLIMAAVLVIAFGWLGLIVAAAGVAGGIAVVVHHRPPRH